MKRLLSLGVLTCVCLEWWLNSPFVVAQEQKTFKLHLKTLECKRTEDRAGPDEAYLVVNGEKKWGPKDINDRAPHNSKELNIVIEFSESVRIDLYDEDNPPIDDNDHLGTITVKSTERGEKEGYFREKGASYIVYYTVEEKK